MPYPAPVLVCSTLALAALIGCAPQAPPRPCSRPGRDVEQPPASPASAPPQAEATPKAVAGAPVQSGLTARLMYELLVGEMSFDLGDPQQGTAYLLDAARRADDETCTSGPPTWPSSRAPVRPRWRRCAWRQAFPQSLQATRYELQVLLALGRVSETAKPVKTLLDALPAAEKVSFIAALPALYQRVASKDEALQAVETALADALKDPALAPAAWTTVGRLRCSRATARAPWWRPRWAWTPGPNRSGRPCWRCSCFPAPAKTRPSP
jgi:hypothetical protein